MAAELGAGAASPAEKLITVGIPVFNGRSLLRNCLQSVINSSLSHDRYEIMVVDDGSTDPETLAILLEFEHRLAAEPGFFRVISSGINSGGAARPRNRILDEATGAYVFFVDADDTIGSLALERIAGAVEAKQVDWIALNQVPTNGRTAVCEISRPQLEVPRARALTTLTVHKVFRRAEIERQGIRFDEALPSGQDVAFAFSYIVNASDFLMLGGYDYYYLTQHAANPNEPVHLSTRAATPDAVIEKNERILRSMLAALRASALAEAEQRTIVARVVLPRIVLQEGYLKALVNAGPEAGRRALIRLSKLCAEPPVAGLDPAELKNLTAEHLALVVDADWSGLERLINPAGPRPGSLATTAAWARDGALRAIDRTLGRTRHRRLVHQLDDLRLSVDYLLKEQRRLQATLLVEFERRDLQTAAASGGSAVDVPAPRSARNLSDPATREVVRHVLQDKPDVVVGWGIGSAAMSIGRALDRAAHGRLIAVESSTEWVDLCRSWLAYEGLDTVDVRLSPPIGSNGDRADPAAALAGIEGIDLLVINGPAELGDHMGSLSSLADLRPLLRPGATVMLDRGHRQHANQTLREWLSEVPDLSLTRQLEELVVLRIGDPLEPD